MFEKLTVFFNITLKKIRFKNIVVINAPKFHEKFESFESENIF